MRGSIVIAWIVLALLGVGCASFDTGSVARRRASELLDCAEADVGLTQIGAYRYRGEGCGRRVEVVCTAAALEPRCLQESELAANEEEREPEAEPEVEEGEGSPEIEARIRAGLEARSEDVLACVGAERVAVRVGYAPDGSVDVSLQGALHGSPEERCVQDALDGVRVAATGTSGVVIHLVR